MKKRPGTVNAIIIISWLQIIACLLLIFLVETGLISNKNNLHVMIKHAIIIIPFNFFILNGIWRKSPESLRLTALLFWFSSFIFNLPYYVIIIAIIINVLSWQGKIIEYCTPHMHRASDRSNLIRPLKNREGSL